MTRLHLILVLLLTHGIFCGIGLVVGEKTGSELNPPRRKTDRSGKFSQFDEEMLRMMIEGTERGKDFDRIHVLFDHEGPRMCWGEKRAPQMDSEKAEEPDEPKDEVPPVKTKQKSKG